MTPPLLPAARSRARGFSLAELMAVVAIIGILAVLAVYGVRQYIQTAKATEVVSIMSSISASQEEYRDETFRYLDVSSSIDDYYPAASPGKFKSAWQTPSHTDYPNWRALGVTTTQPVQYGYACKARTASSTALPGLGISASLNIPADGEWFVCKAVGDVDEDGIQSIFIANHATSEIHAQDEAE